MNQEVLGFDDDRPVTRPVREPEVSLVCKRLQAADEAGLLTESMRYHVARLDDLLRAMERGPREEKPAHWAGLD